MWDKELKTTRWKELLQVFSHFCASEPLISSILGTEVKSNVDGMEGLLFDMLSYDDKLPLVVAWDLVKRQVC